MSGTTAAFTFHSIGVVRSRFTEQRGTPIQPAAGAGTRGRLELEPELAPALADLDGFERIWVLFVLDRARAFAPMVVPYRDVHPRGLFATRAPARPNPIGLSVLRLERIQGSTLFVSDLDILDGSPILDLKPYVPEFDAHPGSRAGWLDSGNQRQRADGRFEE